MGIKSSSYYVRFETAQGLILCAAIAVALGSAARWRSIAAAAVAWTSPRGLLHPPLASSPAAALQSIRCHSPGPHETDEEFDARWVIHFNKPDIAAWELRKGMNTLVGYDLVPEPQITDAALRACRR